MLVAETEARSSAVGQASADVCALQAVDLRILVHLATLEPADDWPWRSAGEVGAALGMHGTVVGWRPMHRLLALELVEKNDRVPLTGGKPVYRATGRGRAAAELVRNPSAASEAVRDHLRFLSFPTEELPTVA